MDNELNNWVSKWDAAQKKDTFKPTPKEAKQEADFFGNYLTKEKSGSSVSLNEADAKYWRMIASGKLVKEQETLVGEPTIEKNPLGSKPLKPQRELPSEKDLAQKGAELANTANPIYPSTRGADQRAKVTPEWSDGTMIREIANMYKNLYDLQVKLNQSPKFGAFGEDSSDIKKIQNQIDELKYKIDELSDSLSPDFVQDELS